MKNTNKEILEVLDDDLKELREEISDKKDEIKDKEEEVDDIEEYEMSDEDVDSFIDDCYDEVEIMGSKYPMSEVLRAVNEGQYEDIRSEETTSYISEKRDEFEDELNDLTEELEELEENYKEEFED